MKHIYSFIRIVALLVLTAGTVSAQNDKLPVWAFGPFIRPAEVNPLISPDTTTRFYELMRFTVC